MKHAKRNWKTTIAGILTLGLTGLSIWHNPAAAGNPQTVSQVVAGVGLVLAKDGDKEPAEQK